LEVFDLLGKRVSILVNENKNSGSHQLNFSANDYGYPSGIYILKLKVDDKEYLRRLVQY